MKNREDVVDVLVEEHDLGELDGIRVEREHRKRRGADRGTFGRRRSPFPRCPNRCTTPCILCTSRLDSDIPVML